MTGFLPEELLAGTIMRLIGDVRHVAVGNASPIPALAIPGLPRSQMSISAVPASPHATSVPAPLSTVTAPKRECSSRAAPRRSVCTAAVSVPNNLAASPGCGVMTQCAGSFVGFSARRFNASATTPRPAVFRSI